MTEDSLGCVQDASVIDNSSNGLVDRSSRSFSGLDESIFESVGLSLGLVAVLLGLVGCLLGALGVLPGLPGTLRFFISVIRKFSLRFVK